jgi:hypothetical protein
MDPEFQKIRNKFRRKHNDLKNRMYNETNDKKQTDVAIKVIQTMTEENIALAAIGYWYDDKTNKWTNRKRTAAEIRQIKKMEKLRKLSEAGDSKASIELMKLYQKGIF